MKDFIAIFLIVAGVITWAVCSIALMMGIGVNGNPGKRGIIMGLLLLALGYSFEIYELGRLGWWR
jgi:formate-dependent nitrite reductase membrane component NrfD